MSVEQTLLGAIRRILYPLIRMALRNGLASDAFTELVRQTYVDVADAEFQIDGKRQTNARISVITGLNRKEVARLRGRDPLSWEDQARRNRAATVLGAWLRDPEFIDRKGDPLDLPFEGTPGFVGLVRKYSGDMQPWAVADELLRVDAIEKVDDKLRMTSRGYVPSSDPQGNFEIIGVDAAELIETMDHNVQASHEDKLLQLKVLADNMPIRYVKEFNDYSRRLLRRVLEDLAGWLAERDEGRKPAGEESRYVLGLGVYQINRPTAGPEALDAEAPAAKDAKASGKDNDDS